MSSEFKAAVTAPLSAQLKMRIRPFADADLGFVTSSWMKSFKPTYADFPNDLYFGGMQGRLRKIFERSDSKCLVACDPSNPGTIYGFVAFEPPADKGGTLVIHYIYVKHDHRRKGVANALFVAAGGQRDQLTVCTHRSFRFEQLQTKAQLTLDSARL